MISPALRAALAAFDDATLAALANPGLVRRARRDVEEGKVALVSAQGDAAEIDADGMRVSIDSRGPRTATCACKLPTVCRHRIAAVLLLQGMPGDAAVAATDDRPVDDASASTEPAAEAATKTANGEPRDIIEALALKALEHWAGKASRRAAFELLDSSATVSASAQAVTVAFDGLDEPIRILRGQGLDGIVSKVAKARQKAWHTAAVLAARRHFGLDLPEAESVETAPPPDTAMAIDPVFLAKVAAALRECVALGFNLAPIPLEESLFEYSVSSRVDHLPRLAALLRAIAAQVRLRRQRSLAFDPDRMLETLATAHALINLLARGEADADRLAGLVGTVRRDYVPSEPLHLIGCGGERWQTAAGGRGVTVWFFEPANGRFLSVAQARGPGQDPTFSANDVWQFLTHWQSKPLKTLAHARLSLTGSGLTSDGRLSSPASAKAMIAAEDARPQSDWDVVVRDWSDLAPLFVSQSGIGLDAGSAAVVCLIAPSASAAPWFDELAQQLVWPLRDAAGQWLAVTLDHDDHSRAAVQVLEATVRSGWQGVILVRLIRQGDGMAVVPVTLFGPGAPLDISFANPSVQRDRATGATPVVRDWLSRLRGSTTRLHRIPPDATAAAIAGTWRLLLDRTEVGQSLGNSLDTERDRHADRLDAIGLPTLAAHLRATTDADSLLTAAYATMLIRTSRIQPGLLA